MLLENSFEVPAPPDRAWALLNDIPRILPCMPGAELTEVVGENAWKAALHVKLGPIAMQFATDVTRDVEDEAARRVVLSAKARELRGRGGAQGTIESSLAASEGGTRVSIVTDLTLHGTVAQFGRGVAADVAAQLTKQFAACLAGQLGDEPAAPPAAVKPIGGVRLGLGALRRSFARLFRRR